MPRLARYEFLAIRSPNRTLICDQDWLATMTSNKKQIWPHLTETYGEKDTAMWYYRWQIFYMACAELFAYEGGDTWGISHYLFEKPTT
jgi:cation-transporting ATPase 13A3/4/5